MSADIVEKIVQSAGEADLPLSSSEANVLVEAVFESIIDELREEGEVTVEGFGTFEVRHREERTGCNPREGEDEEIVLEPFTDVRFRPEDSVESEVVE
ncbi:MAG: HU family DNA-binding protein [Bradymonadaceae bacterium]